MSRILVLSPWEPPSDGIAKHTARLVDAWERAGHTVLVASPGKESGVVGSESVEPRSGVARVLRKFPRRRTRHSLQDFEPDLVYVQFAIAAVGLSLWSVRDLCRRFSDSSVPIVIGYHEPAKEYNLLGPLTRRVYKSIARVTDVPVVFSSVGRQALIGNGLFDDVVELPHGTSGVAKVSEADIERVRKAYDLRRPLVLTLGFTTTDKGADVLIAAANSIAESQDNEVQFLIAGSPRVRRGVFRVMRRGDIKCQHELERQASGITRVEIAFRGFVAEEDVAALLREAAVVALPYRRITQSGIANLALSSEAVIVASDLPGLRSDLGDAARYVEPDNSEALANEISSLLGEENIGVRRRMRAMSGERANAHTYAKVAEGILIAGEQRTLRRTRTPH